MNTVAHPRLPARRSAARATRWWGKAWVRAVEESAYAERDLAAGRVLARSGRVGQIATGEGSFVASVEDDDGLWTVSGTVPVLDAPSRDALLETVAAEVGRLAALLSGDLPHDLVEHAEETGVELLPYGSELQTTCTCAAWADPCAHALAVLYQLTWLLEEDPFVLLHLRGLSRDDVVAGVFALQSHQPESAAADGQDGGQNGEPDEGVDPQQDEDLDVAWDAALRAQRLLDVLDEEEREAPPPGHLF
ncbi:SWIM zinc finger family protein [Nocardioides sp.]|uniref:SWIM zinc finger family protein n=1 Tax=Nocardioides sp. TaxID=35761 RepID=UPI003565D35E